jgi:glutamate formiminotransferase/glutamate formiminotransferase/formiminotetrahydrofolate cyclodeaminase
VFLYGELAQGRTRAQLRRGGVSGLAERLRARELRPDFGPDRLHPTAGATLVAAREPLVAFNLELASPASVEDARRIASLIREGGPEGLQGLRAIGVPLRRTVREGDYEREGFGESVVAQVSMNVERPLEVPLRAGMRQWRARSLSGLLPGQLSKDSPRMSCSWASSPGCT